MVGLPKTKSAKPIKIAPRNAGNEQFLCEAMKRRFVVRFRYKDDIQIRDFAPHVVEPTSTGKMCVSGVLIKNPNDLTDELGWHNFEVGLITGLTVTDRTFAPDPKFDRSKHSLRALGTI